MAKRKRAAKDALPPYQASPGRNPHVRVIIVAGAAILLCLLLGLACREFWRRLYTDNPHFAFTTLQFKATDNFSAEAVIERLRELGVEERQVTLPQLDLRKLRNGFMENPLLEDAEFRRILPNTLDITLREREIAAAIVCSPPRTIDRHGIVLPPDVKGCPADLPRITGIASASSLQVGQPVEDPLIRAALDFLNRARLREESYLRCVRTIQLDNRNGNLCLYLDANGVFKPMAKITLPVKDMDDALDRLAGIVMNRTALGQPIATVDVTFKTHIPVTPMTP